MDLKNDYASEPMDMKKYSIIIWHTRKEELLKNTNSATLPLYSNYLRDEYLCDVVCPNSVKVSQVYSGTALIVGSDTN